MAKKSKISESTKKIDNNVKLSVIVPCCNVEKYLDQCLKSIVDQTFKEMEIICVNDGSKDNTLSIIEKYASKDKRIKILDKPNSGYGDSMNKGFELATGKYIGIVESDDFIEPEMFKVLYETAVKFDADVVKSNFWFYWGETEENELHEYFRKEECGYVICPHEYDNGSLYGRKPSIWSAIYKNDFIKENNISFLPTPGASFQDTSFTFKVYSSAKKMVCLYDAFLHYRQDNAGSSVNNADKKIDFVFQEYREIEKFIKENQQEQELNPIYAAAFYDTCIWTYERLSVGKRYSFLKTISPWFKELIDKVGTDNIAFGECWWKRRDIARIANNPIEYQTWRNIERYEQNFDNLSFKEPVTPLSNIKKMRPRSNKNGPMFSIVVPVYNVEKYLSSCLDTIVNQTFDDIEIICVNDGSTDHSLSIIEEYAGFDKRIKIINQKNAGLAAARNSGLSGSAGKYVLFVDSDDYISLNTCDVLNKKINSDKRNADAILFGTNIFPDNPRADEWYYQTLSTNDEYIENIDVDKVAVNRNLGVFVWRFCFKKSFMDEKNITFDASVRYGEDAVFLYSALPKVCCLMSISDKLYYYRHYRENSLMNEAKKDNTVFAQHQLDILRRIIESVKRAYGEFSSAFYEYASDFVYRSIEDCNLEYKLKYRNEFVKIIKKHNIDKYIDNCADNYKAYWEECLSSDTTTKRKKFKVARNIVQKVMPPSRQAFYDYYSKLINQVAMQQNSINSIQQQIDDIKNRIDNQKNNIDEIKWLSNELIKKYNDDELWRLHNLLEDLLVNNDDNKG